YGEVFGGEPPEAYERLLLDAIHGDATLYARGDWVEKAWQLLGPVLDAWAEAPGPPLCLYEAGSWGPAEADAFIARDGGAWRQPIRGGDVFELAPRGVRGRRRARPEEQDNEQCANESLRSHARSVTGDARNGQGIWPARPREVAPVRERGWHRSALDRVAAVDGNGGSRDEVGGGAREEDRDARHVVDGTPAAGRRALEDPLVQARDLLPRPARERGVDPARQHRVDLNIVQGPRRGARPGELNDPALGGGVGRREAGAEDGHHRTDVDDLAAAARLHRRVGRVRAEVGARQVGVKHLAPLGERHLVRGLPDVGARVVDEDVEPPEGVERRPDHAPDRRLVSDVRCDGARLGAESLQLLHRVLGLGLVARRDHDARAGSRE